MAHRRLLRMKRKQARPAAGLIRLLLCSGCAALCLWSAPAAAQTAPSGGAQATQAEDQAGSKDFWTGFWHRSTMLGDIFGLRPWLGSFGVSFNLQEISEVLGNLTGGFRRGATYDGLTTMTLQMDTGKAFGLDDGLFNASALQIHGRNLSAENLGTLQAASGIEADRATRLWELWYQQGLSEGAVDVKLGQQSLDQEFIVSQYAGLFVNTMFGWPMVPTADLPSGGPAYPLSSLGVRLRAKPNDSLTVLAGVFDDNPAGPGTGDPQLRNASGTAFRLSDGVLSIAEVQYALNQPGGGEMHAGGGELGMPGTYKLGMWYDSGNFADQRYDNMGLSLANPASSGIPRPHRGDFSVYAVMDQMIWRPSSDSAQSLGFFLRPMAAPADRNLIDLSLNVGLTLKDPLPGRDNDTAGVGLGYAQVSGRASGLDRDAGFFSGTSFPVRSSEEFVEVTYQFQLAPWWQLQPDFQYTFNPGAGVRNPMTLARVRNETVVGVRTTLTF